MNKEIQPYTWVLAQLAGCWLKAWYTGRTSNGGYIVNFDADSPSRIVREIKELEDKPVFK